MLRIIIDKIKDIKVLHNTYRHIIARTAGNKGANSYKYYRYPWEISLEKRIALIGRNEPNSKTDKPAVVYVYPEAEPGTFRYRVYNTSVSLNDSEKYRASYFFQNELETVKNLIPIADLIIFARQGWSPEAEEIVDLMHKSGKKVGFDLDDMVFNPDTVTELITQIDAPRDAHGYYFYYVGIQYSLAKVCDFYVSTNQYLADKLTEFFNKPSYVIPNYVNQEQVERSQKLNESPKDKALIGAETDNVVIGYFSGTRTHNRDFGLIEDALVKILKEFANVKLLIVGELGLSEKFDKFEGRILREGLKNFVELQDYKSVCDINLAPLVINDFTNCKSELKYFEAALVKVPTVASPTYTFSTAIESGVNGMLAKNGEWYESIKSLVEDQGLRVNMGQKAYKRALHDYFGEVPTEITTKVIETVLEL